MPYRQGVLHICSAAALTVAVLGDGGRDGVYNVGLGSRVIQCMNVGRGAAVVGAGAVVSRGCARNTRRSGGVPGR